MNQLKLIFIAASLTILTLFYFGSIYIAFNKGYNKHVQEIERQAIEVVVGSHSDILEAAKEAKDVENNIKTDTDECNYIWNFDLSKCLSK